MPQRMAHLKTILPMLKRLELLLKLRVLRPQPRKTLKQLQIKLRLILRRTLLPKKLRQRLPSLLRKQPQRPLSRMHLSHKLRIMMRVTLIWLSCHILFFQTLFITIKCKKLIQSLVQ